MNIVQCLVALFLFVLSPSGFAAQPESFSFRLSARISDASRTNEIRMEASEDRVPANKLLRLSKDDIRLEIAPKSRDRENVLFSYRVTKKGADLSTGEFLARVGQKSHLVAGHRKSGHLVSLTVKIPGHGVPYNQGEPKVLLGQQSAKYTPL
jgi:hypothetical protein